MEKRNIFGRRRSGKLMVAYGGSLVCDFGETNELLALTLVGDFPF